MVRRIARRGAHQGSEFRGCPKFPECRGTIFDSPPAEAESAEEDRPTSATEQPEDDRTEGGHRTLREKVSAAVVTVAKTVDKAQRWYLESDEPDATGRWSPEHGRKVLRYVYDRDGGRCGLCGGKMKIQGAHIEHIVPKVFAVFDVRKGGKAVTGNRYNSRLHRLDNLQAAHTYCNKRKGNTPEVSKWRHPAMPALTVAEATDGREFVVPWKPTR